MRNEPPQFFTDWNEKGVSRVWKHVRVSVCTVLGGKEQIVCGSSMPGALNKWKLHAAGVTYLANFVEKSKRSMMGFPDPLWFFPGRTP